MHFVTPESNGAPEPDHALLEYNTCHAPDSGKFCSKGGGTADAFGFSQGKGKTQSKGRTTAQDHLNQTISYGGVQTRRGDVIKDLQRQGATPQMVDRYLQGADLRGRVTPLATGRKHTFTPSGPNHITTHRGVEIHTLPSYTTPYYYGKHPALGSMHHSQSLRRVKNQINRIVDHAMTPKRAASIRYMKRKARGY